MQIVTLHVDSNDLASGVSQLDQAGAIRVQKGLAMAARSPKGEKMPPRK